LANFAKDGHNLTVKSRDGQLLSITLADNAPIALHRGGEPAQIEDVGQVGDRGPPTQ
jgi:hypothetical protein